MCIRDSDGCLQKDLSTMLSMSKQTINSSIRRLEKDDFLTLTSGKGRQMHIYLTPKGRQFCEKKIFPLIAMENKAFSCMKKDECNLMSVSYTHLDVYKRQQQSTSEIFFLPPSPLQIICEILSAASSFADLSFCQSFLPFFASTSLLL